MQFQLPYRLTATPQGIFLDGEPLNKSTVNALPSRSLSHIVHACELMSKMTPKDWEPPAPHGPNDIPQSALFETHLAMANAGLLNKFNFNPGELRDAWGRWIADAVGSIVPSAGATELTSDSGKESHNRKAVSAVAGDNKIIITNNDGSREIRSGGSASWRCNNPGNMSVEGPPPPTLKHLVGYPVLGWRFVKADSAGKNAKDHYFAIFRSETEGFDALVAQLQRPMYRAKKIGEMFQAYAPIDDGNDPDAYTNDVLDRTKLSPETRLGSLTPAQIESIANAIKKHEKWDEGTVTITEGR